MSYHDDRLPDEKELYMIPSEQLTWDAVRNKLRIRQVQPGTVKIS